MIDRMIDRNDLLLLLLLLFLLPKNLGAIAITVAEQDGAFL